MAIHTSSQHIPEQPNAGHLRRISMELTALSEAGIWYGTDQFDLERFHRIGALAHELMNLVSIQPLPPYDRTVASAAGYSTPKVDVRGAVFDGDGRVLLVRETLDAGRWTLPGGWCDILESPKSAIEREVLEEAGLATKATHLAAVVDRDRWPHQPPMDHHIYKLFFVCEPMTGVDLNYTSNETSGIGWFAVDNLPELSVSRVLPDQIALLQEHWRNPGAAYFD